MVDDNDMLELGRKGQLTANVTFLMLKGAGYGAVVFFGLWIGIWVLAQLATLLPDERLETPDPVNRSSYELIVEEVDWT